MFKIIGEYYRIESEGNVYYVQSRFFVDMFDGQVKNFLSATKLERIQVSCFVISNDKFIKNRQPVQTLLESFLEKNKSMKTPKRLYKPGTNIKQL